MIAVILHFGVMGIAAVMLAGALYGVVGFIYFLAHQPKIGE